MSRKSHKRKSGLREPNGRLSRKAGEVAKREWDGLDAVERDALSTGLEARQRVHAVPMKMLRDQMAGSFVGRLTLGKEMTRQQYDAAMSYLEDYHNNLRAIQAPRQPGAIDLNATKGGSGDYENVRFYREATSRWRAAQAAVQERQNELRGAGVLIAALDYLVIRDMEFHHLVGSLREALNALARHYRLTNAEAA